MQAASMPSATWSGLADLVFEAVEADLVFEAVEVGNVVVASMVGDWRLRCWRVVDLVETSLFPGWPRKTDY